MSNSNTLSKSELADHCQVSMTKIRRWCNVDFFEDLQKLGYSKHQHLFTPCQTQFLKQNLLEYTER